ncbi:hypothetical protein NPIL_338811 [Nephila pilipes]|uniref:Single domain-containing protein n=1 Tax=Nephila pilipes TaxID=299642 RepID=A0A8X6MU76_NEPPI|nr:hypothetical protein NPIL_338811 [Nephila pilipes]
MSRVFAIGCILMLITILNAYEFVEYLNTQNGYCDSNEFGRIPLGDSRYDDDQCERIVCRPGILTTVGCGSVGTDDPKCRIVTRQGRYPDCCPTVTCG